MDLFVDEKLQKRRERALRILGVRPMSSKELFDKLVAKGESPEDAAECVAFLIERHYLDDVAFAAMVVRHYAGKGYGKKKIQSELYRRGVDRALWDEALEEMPETEDVVFRLLCRKIKSETPDRAEMKKAAEYLFRRGFSWDEIRSAVNRFESGEVDD